MHWATENFRLFTGHSLLPLCNSNCFKSPYINNCPTVTHINKEDTLFFGQCVKV